jgi:hypothetical protein
MDVELEAHCIADRAVLVTGPANHRSSRGQHRTSQPAG